MSEQQPLLKEVSKYIKNKLDKYCSKTQTDEIYTTIIQNNLSNLCISSIQRNVPENLDLSRPHFELYRNNHTQSVGHQSSSSSYHQQLNSGTNFQDFTNLETSLPDNDNILLDQTQSERLGINVQLPRTRYSLNPSSKLASSTRYSSTTSLGSPYLDHHCTRQLPNKNISSAENLSLCNSNGSTSYLNSNLSDEAGRSTLSSMSLADSVSSFEMLEASYSNKSFESTSNHSVVKKSCDLPDYNTTTKLLSNFNKADNQETYLKPLFFEVPQSQCCMFVGRDWLYDIIFQYVDSQDCLLVCVYGTSGVGKTSIILNLVLRSGFGQPSHSLYNGNSSLCDMSKNIKYCPSADYIAQFIVAYHFCQCNQRSTCMPGEFVHSLAAQLCQCPRTRLYADRLRDNSSLRLLLNLRYCRQQPLEALTQGVLRQLSLLYGVSAPPCLVVIDSLSESVKYQTDYGESLLTFVLRALPLFPKWLKLVVTNDRPLHASSSSCVGAENICLDSSMQRQDIHDYLRERVANSASIRRNIHIAADKQLGTGCAQFVQHVHGLVGHSFYHASALLDLVARGHVRVRSARFRALPANQHEVHLLNMKLLFRTASAFTAAAPLLNCCVACERAPSIYELYQAVCALQTRVDVRWDAFVAVLRQLLGFPLYRHVNDTYSLVHAEIGAWLCAREASPDNPYTVDSRAGHASIALAMSRSAQSSEVRLDDCDTVRFVQHALRSGVFSADVPGTALACGAVSPRRLLALWLSLVAGDVSSCLASDHHMALASAESTQLLLLAGADVERRTTQLDAATPLLVSAASGHTHLCSVMLRSGANPDARNQCGRTALMLAAQGAHEDTVRELLAQGADHHLLDSEGRTALSYVARAENVCVLEHLLAHNRSVSGPDGGAHESYVTAALVECATVGNVRMLEYIFTQTDANIDGVSSAHNSTALIAACANGHVEAVKLLLGFGADPSLASAVTGRNALHAAAGSAIAGRSTQVCTCLLQCDVMAVNGADCGGRSALMLAAAESETCLLDLLLSHGADIDQADAEGLTALSWACMKSRLANVKFLLANNANALLADVSGRTALHLAVLFGDTKLATLLLENGADVNSLNKQNMSPIECAVACDNIYMIRCLVQHNADLNASTWNLAKTKINLLYSMLNCVNNLGVKFYQQSKIVQAEQRFSTALENFPDQLISSNDMDFKKLYVNLILNLSRCRRKLNDAEYSVKLATLAMSLSPDSYEPYFYRAKCYHMLKQYDRAMEDLRIALVLSPADKSIRRVIHQVKYQTQLSIPTKMRLSAFGSVDTLTE